jgi:ABC-type nitrate/sulfonate/bicarbonate transport system permease component
MEDMAEDTKQSRTGDLNPPEPAPGFPTRMGLLERHASLLLVLAALAAWEAAARLGWLSILFFPAPSSIAAALVEWIVSGELAVNLEATLYRFGTGLAAGGAAGFVCGMAFGISPRLRRILDPLVSGVYAIPKLALFPLFLILFGLGDSSRIVLIALGAFFPMLINTMAGIRQINPDYFEIARSYGTSRSMMMRRIVVPGSLPSVLSGVRLAVGTSLMITIAVELINSSVGLGALIWRSWQTLQTEILYIALLTAAMLGIGSHLLLELLSRRLIPWQAEMETDLPGKAIPEI